MAKKSITFDLDHIIALRDHHLQEAARYDGVLATLKDVAKLQHRADVLTGKVRARASAEGGVPRSTSWLHQQPPEKVEEIRAKARARWRRAAAKRAATAPGGDTRPSEVVRQLFRESKGKALTREMLIDHVPGVGGKGQKPGVPNPAQRARVLGLILQRMTQGKEIKETAHGYVAVKVQPPVAVSVNGAHAE
jgi:hypothetical protein